MYVCMYELMYVVFYIFNSVKKSRKMRWVKHVAWMGEMRNA